MSFDPDRHAPAGPEDADGPAGPGVADLRTVLGALEELPELERRAITLRHVDGLNPQTCQLLLGITPRRWRRLHPRALRLLREALAARGDTNANCRRTRMLVDQGLLAPALAIRRDAHLEECVSCRAYRHLRDTDPLERPVRPLGDPACLS